MLSVFEQNFDHAANTMSHVFGIKGFVEDENGRTFQIPIIKQQKTKNFKDDNFNIFQEQISIFVVRKTIEECNSITNIKFDDKNYSVSEIKGKDEPFVEFVLTEISEKHDAQEE